MTAFPLEIEVLSRKLRLKNYRKKIIFSSHFTIISITNLIIHEKRTKVSLSI